MTTIPNLLESKMYRFNQSFLARELGVNRGTLNKYAEDYEGDYHVVIENELGIELFTNQTNKINKVK